MSDKPDKEELSTPTIVKRKVQVTGGSTYIVSIPKEWAKVLGIERGSEVTLELAPEGFIRVRAPKSAFLMTQRVAEINLTDGLSDSVFLMEVLSSYLAGYDTIRVTFDPKLSEVAERVAAGVRSKAIGLELLEESDEHLTLKIVVDPTSMSPQSAMENMIKVVKSMLDDVDGVIRGLKDREVLEAVVRRDDIVDKLYLYIFKQLNLALQGLLEPSKLNMSSLAEAIGIYTQVKSLERIADQVVSIAQWLEEFRGVVPTHLRDLFSRVRLEVESVVDLARIIRPEMVLKYYERLHEVATQVLDEYVKARSSGCANECYPLFDGTRRIVAQAIDLLEALMGLHMIRGLSQRRP